MIKVCLIADFKLTRNAYMKALTSFEEFEVMGDFDNINNCIEFMEKTKVDVVLVDILKGNPDAYETVCLLKEKFNDVKVIVIAEEEFNALQVLSNGASGYVLKNISMENLARIIKDAIDGNLVIASGVVFAPVWQEKIKKERFNCNLTDREKEILDRITKGKSNTEIGKELYLSVFTVKNYVSKIIEKLEVKDRTEATAKAIKCGLV